MSTGFPLLVGAGPLPELKMREACEALAKACQCHLTTVAIGDSPAAVLQNKPARTGLVRLSGDAARPTPDGDASWLQALADWRQPVLLLTMADSDGTIPGTAPAYAALCRELSVPLLGLVQLQGPWNGPARRRDGLSWLGWIPDLHHPDQAECLNALARRLQYRNPRQG
ncbi:hypothetical protein KR52_08175 [Synechococcus sp. KORDI-52]|uniref:hypothetical protein n=1 Tax=Synechococcus sp. KORDI-52 TaxID=585425 RepID=UPI0004E03D81|nr:hypothetical protein [Synechococcus sp. KORDI-52]AII49116.1 hypothetical protein KR52_08175 [Synechococcus sp. KORDI-52]